MCVTLIKNNFKDVEEEMKEYFRSTLHLWDHKIVSKIDYLTVSKQKLKLPETLSINPTSLSHESSSLNWKLEISKSTLTTLYHNIRIAINETLSWINNFIFKG